jgi:hypothetical protein
LQYVCYRRAPKIASAHRFEIRQNVGCNFRPHNIDARRGLLAACSDGDQLLICDAYTGELLFETEQNGRHLTNCVRLFWPNVIDVDAPQYVPAIDDDDV